MADMDPRALDIETSGLGREADITVAGIASDIGSWLVLNTGGRPADAQALEDELENRSDTHVTLDVAESEKELLLSLTDCVRQRIDSDKHYLTAYNGETWRGGFDLPFLRKSCIRNNVDWPFCNLAYVDIMQVLSKIDTGDVSDLVGSYDFLIGDSSCDPFEDSKEAVTAYNEANWDDLLAHNLADILRTYELAELASRYVPQSDFRMKNLNPPTSNMK